MTTAVSAPQVPRRVHALDALRGAAILMMILSGVVPETYPAWMHHAQCPPPTLKFNPNIAGITWVDLVFPFFLFSMGAAIPLALGRRIEKGEPWWRMGWGVFQRFLLLGLFAVYVDHIRPFAIGAPEIWLTWDRALVAFIALLAILARLPDDWRYPVKLAVRAVGWGVAAFLMYTVRREGGIRFDPHSYDIIIMILANVALGVSLVWALTRNNLPMRLGFMAFLLAIRLSSAGPGWVQRVWTASPEHWLFTHHLYPTDGPWLFHQGFMSLLFIAIPGSIVGDLLVKWIKAPRDEGAGWTNRRWSAVAALSFALVPVLLWGLFTRHVVEAAALSLCICAVIRCICAKPSLACERLVNEIARWGAFWVVLGLLCEPYEHGIHKDPATLSYYFIPSGLACFTLIAFISVMDALKRPWALRLLADNGQNPMIAYVGLSNLVQPALFIIPGMKAWVDKGCQAANGSFALSVIEVALVALAVSGFTRAKVFFRT